MIISLVWIHVAERRNGAQGKVFLVWENREAKLLLASDKASERLCFMNRDIIIISLRLISLRRNNIRRGGLPEYTRALVSKDHLRQRTDIKNYNPEEPRFNLICIVCRVDFSFVGSLRNFWNLNFTTTLVVIARNFSIQSHIFPFHFDKFLP